MSGLPDYSLFEPSVMTFVVIPIALMVLLIWAVAAAWRAAGRPAASVRLTALATLAISVVWLNVTWSLAQGGVLAQWDRRTTVHGAGGGHAGTGFRDGVQSCRRPTCGVHPHLGAGGRSNPFGCRWSSPCTAWRSAASCRRR